jgi:hypothetical protein
MSTVLLPPKPLETDMASGSGWRFTSPLSQSTPGLSMGSVSRSVGSSAPARTAMIVTAASRAPAAPRQCPKYDLVEDTGMGWLRPRKAALVGIGLGNVVQRRARAVGIHIADLIAAHLRHVHGKVDAVGQSASLLLRRGGVKSIVGHGPSAQHRQNVGVARAGPGQRLEDENSGPFAQVQALAILIERESRGLGLRLEAS